MNRRRGADAKEEDDDETEGGKKRRGSALEGRPAALAKDLLLESIAIENVDPELDCGRFPVKRQVGDTFRVSADVFKYGKDVIRASLKYRREGSTEWDEVEMRYFDNDRWSGEFVLDAVGVYEYTIEAWTDLLATAVRDLQKWVAAGEDVSVDMVDLRKMVDAAISNSKEPDLAELSSLWNERKDDEDYKRVIGAVAEPRFMRIVGRGDLVRRGDVKTHRTLRVVVDRRIAGFAAWYELFPRSQGTVPGQSGTFKDCERRLPEIQRLGFDVVYLSPIHPIGRTNRRGRNNSPTAGPDDPGSPWAIGNEEEGGHTSIHPELGTMKDFERFLESARGLNLEVALDLAFQCSPDHPYVRSHPEWFFHRSDGTIRYAENPPKKYFDIYPLQFENPHWRELWREMLAVVVFWVERGVKIFRVDNPHTKPLGFWEWMIQSVKKDHPDVIFLAEAFTRPKLMKRLAKLGFSQSYTYFAWKNTKSELMEFLQEFVTSKAAEYYRGNFFTNTPDILTAYLQMGGRPAFKVRLALAATLSSLYGIYSGYELCENDAAAPGSEEYRDSEKYQYKPRDWERQGNIKDYIAKINTIRRDNVALQSTGNLRLLRSNNDNILFYGKWTEDRSNIILVAVNLDPFHVQDSYVFVPLGDLGLEPSSQTYSVLDLVTDREYRWKGEQNYVRLDPHDEPANIFRLVKG